MELDRMKLPFCTLRDFCAPSGVILSAVLVIYLASGSTSPILIQFTPPISFVMKFFIGRGDAPREIVAINPNGSLIQPNTY